MQKFTFRKHFEHLGYILNKYLHKICNGLVCVVDREIENILIELIQKHCKEVYNDEYQMINLDLLSEKREEINDIYRKKD